ncbi:MAG TPA: radical SAM protein [Methylomirabilota bacterium]|nr:radical SAM protein [Methylomirabilota bacterium]
MNESRYNYRFRTPDGSPAVLNGLSGSVIGDPGGPLDQPGLPPADRDFLVRHHFLVADAGEERRLLLARNHAANTRRDRVELTLMLHEECNFRCTYCFEDFKNQELDATRISHLTAFVDARLPEGGTLAVHFYGGEPLLAWDSLVAVVDAFEALTGARGARFSFYVTTNGSLLGDDRARYLARHGAQHVKITLDGPPDVHDRRRPRKGGQASFDAVLAGVRAALAELPVLLRVNVDADNVERVAELLDILERACGEGRRRLQLDLNPVYDKDAGRLRLGVPYARLTALQHAALDRGFAVYMPPLLRTRYCKFNSVNSYLVDTAGELYRCSQDADFRVGALAPPPGAPPAARAAAVDARFQEVKSVCLECRLLPICGGGCTLLAHRAAPPCPGWADDLETYLALQYRVLTPPAPAGAAHGHGARALSV